MLKSLRAIVSGLRNLRVVPLDPGDTPLYLRLLERRFWFDMFKIANETSGNLLWHFYIGLGAFILYFGALILGILSANPVLGDSTALSDHPQCGIAGTIPPAMHDAQLFSRTRRYYNDVARESRQYAESCYNLGSSSNESPDSCSFFYKPWINYVFEDNDPCPFTDGDDHLCLQGPNSAFTVTTGIPGDILTDASDLGINSRVKYRFHRSLTCAPLITDGRIESFNDKRGMLGHRYFYGRGYGGNRNCTSTSDNCTFEIVAYPGARPSYSML
jgi:hypothetical protein